ncbi:MAG: hypothetical protein VYA44_04465, partial [SAR324 cluster bacterium]|nr:hypothetical protein [SAR324 cluster bacterium]
MKDVLIPLPTGLASKEPASGKVSNANDSSIKEYFLHMKISYVFQFSFFLLIFIHISAAGK